MTKELLVSGIVSRGLRKKSSDLYEAGDLRSLFLKPVETQIWQAVSGGTLPWIKILSSESYLQGKQQMKFLFEINTTTSLYELTGLGEI